MGVGRVEYSHRGGNYKIAAQSNNIFNRSANSTAFIENLSVMALCARPVNSSVRRLLLFYNLVKYVVTKKACAEFSMRVF